MKREFTLDIDGQQITVTAVRDGDVIRVSRGDEHYAVRILGESVPGVQEASRVPTGAGGPAARGELRTPAAGARSVPPSGAAVPAAGATQAAGVGPSTGAGGAGVVSPMTGVVDQVAVAVGDTVSEGQVIVVLEAMKMYIDVMAPEAGTVTAVTVEAGDSVREGQALVSIAAAGAG